MGSLDFVPKDGTMKKMIRKLAAQVMILCAFTYRYKDRHLDSYPLVLEPSPGKLSDAASEVDRRLRLRVGNLESLCVSCETS